MERSREKVSTVRQRIGDLLNRVALRHDEFIIERNRKQLVELFESSGWSRCAGSRTVTSWKLERQDGGPLSDEEAIDLAVEAQCWARGHSKQRGA
jgi:hypothetical protein